MSYDIHPESGYYLTVVVPSNIIVAGIRRKKQTILTRFRCVFLRTLTFKDGNKVLLIFVRYSAVQASLEHIVDCLWLTKQDLYEDLLMLLEFSRVSEIMDLV
ncbi:hypothetical protein TNCV_4379751 [Trichonephila clavipes]|nr:hypothetical protein TNCV_4379751 [Trichonephila clavipes]